MKLGSEDVVSAAINEDYYEGYYIPAGTTVIANSWAILHDPSIYPDPFTFNPDRFLESDPQMDPEKIAFGYGHRVCPGRHLASNSLWLAIASLLSTFSIEKALDSTGKEITPVVDCSDGVVSHPLDFQCRFVPRSQEVIDLIRIGYPTAQSELVY
ncbi:cytochrome P450-like protein [Mycena floridula]|nr:cytochrome P450-like protein [Mycena floridula]